MGEAVRIRRRGGVVLNSKAEYNRCSIVRLTIPETDSPPPTNVGKDDHPDTGGEEWAVPGGGLRKAFNICSNKKAADPAIYKA